jgi:predicted protein tyrosine phosphatase
MDDVKKALEWSKGKDRIVVHCGAGVSRSSSIAYVIACQRLGAKEAVKILDMSIHAPNPLIVSLGAEALNDKSVEDECGKAEAEFIRKWEGGLL